MRVVLDTNVFISAIAFGGKPKIILEKAIKGDIQLVLSDPILEELQGVLLGKKFNYPPHIVIEIAQQLASLAEIVYPEDRILIIKSDPADNRILECAVAGMAKYIVSGDADLLMLRIYEKIRIVTPDVFLKSG
ncbi:MAG: putative toxin-antitoxin system toxin component, PIN family [Candidatus Omnitrophica bacterium]|nr:putative toxin-antitoxin system toxin component, PIN family [Candidatus Omnitrophota bacterium]